MNNVPLRLVFGLRLSLVCWLVFDRFVARVCGGRGGTADAELTARR
jgi:hypothetical protein